MLSSITKALLAVTASATLLITSAFAAPLTDVQKFTNNTASDYFVANDTQKYKDPYYRWAGEDWSRTQSAIAGTVNSTRFNTSAFDVDFFNPTFGDVDTVYVFDGSAWLNVAALAGTDEIWAFTSFDLSSFNWAHTQVNAGLHVKMAMDTLNEGWAATLGKATLNVDGGKQECLPAPGIPCTAVAEPSSIALFGLALSSLGFGLRRRTAKNRPASHLTVQPLI